MPENPKTDWTVDASKGGSLFRTALGLSALTGKSVLIENIRKDRANPGLESQHLACLQAVSKLCNAKADGNVLHSWRVRFFPKKPVDSQISVKIGTAGSVSLVLFSVLFPSLVSSNRLRVLGGTHVPLAPSTEFLESVLFPALRKMNGRFSLRLNLPGFFPKGNGMVHFASEPAKFPLKKIKRVQRGEIDFVDCFSRCAGLPEEIARRQSDYAKKNLLELNAGFETHVLPLESNQTIGTSIVLLAHFSNGAVLSATALGKKGVPAETVSNNAVLALKREIASKAACDRFLGDQLVPFMALARGTSVISVSNFTEHCQNTLNLCKRLLDADFTVAGKIGEPAEITVDGIGFVRKSDS